MSKLPWQRAAAFAPDGERPAQPRPWYRVNAAGQPAGTVQLDLYDVIGGWFWGVDATSFVRDLRQIEASTIDLHVNSPGGDVFDAIAIMNALRQHDARIVVTVDGLAASAASFIAVGAADELVMSRNAELMIHDAWGIEIGNAADLRKAADDLDRISDNIASIYADRAGGDVATWRDTMREETWYSDAEAVSAGLADRVSDARKADEAAKNRWDLSVFAHAGRRSAPEPPRAAALVRPRNERSGTVPTFLDAVRQRLGTAADADEATVLGALDEALNEQVEQPEGRPAAALLPEGVVAVEQTALDALRADAELGRQAHARQAREDRERTVDAAIADGRIAPARRDAWLNRLEADPAEVDTLNALEKGLVPVAPVGRDDAPEALDADSVYEQLFGKEG